MQDGIVAEQAITDLSSIVKELVDNALDADSTAIKSKLCYCFKILCSLTS
jgi:DNA mismatch repair ATPase MutL